MLQLLDANMALLIAAAGMLLICLEFCAPGWVVPGAGGGVLLVSGIYRLAAMEAAPGAAASLAAVLLLIGVSAFQGELSVFGWLPVVVIPWICRQLLPGQIHWTAAGIAAIPPAAAFCLLRVAARAAANKTFL